MIISRVNVGNIINGSWKSRQDTHIPVYTVYDVLGWKVRNLRVDFCENVGEGFDEVVPFLFGETIHRFCKLTG